MSSLHIYLCHVTLAHFRFKNSKKFFFMGPVSESAKGIIIPIHRLTVVVVQDHSVEHDSCGQMKKDLEF